MIDFRDFLRKLRTLYENVTVESGIVSKLKEGSCGEDGAPICWKDRGGMLDADWETNAGMAHMGMPLKWRDLPGRAQAKKDICVCCN